MQFIYTLLYLSFAPVVALFGLIFTIITTITASVVVIGISIYSLFSTKEPEAYIPIDEDEHA